MSKLPGDPSLPPGCSIADIERRFGDGDEEDYCADCAEHLTPEERERDDHDGLCDKCWGKCCPQCGTKLNHDTGYCSQCKETVR